jgi:ketosteroid isomerase-like protein
MKEVASHDRDFDHLVELFQQAVDEFFRGNPEPAKRLVSHRDDVTLGNPFGPFARGWQQVNDAMDRAGLNYKDGGATAFEVVARRVTPELGYTVWVERFKSRIAGAEAMASGALRRTTVYRPEDGVWKVVHSQADPITTARPAESVIRG